MVTKREKKKLFIIGIGLVTVALSSLFLFNGANINLKNNNGQTPLHSATLSKNYEVAELLIKKGANVNAKNNYGKTPLDYVESLANSEIAELLIKHGAKVNSR